MLGKIFRTPCLKLLYYWLVSPSQEGNCWLLVADWAGITLYFEGLYLLSRVSFRGTLRVPDNNKSYALPPDCGPFPVYSVIDRKESPLEHLVLKGGVFTPIYCKYLSMGLPMQIIKSHNSSLTQLALATPWNLRWLVAIPSVASNSRLFLWRGNFLKTDLLPFQSRHSPARGPQWRRIYWTPSEDCRRQFKTVREFYQVDKDWFALEMRWRMVQLINSADASSSKSWPIRAHSCLSPS